MSRKLNFRRGGLIQFANSSASSLPGMERFMGSKEQKRSDVSQTRLPDIARSRSAERRGRNLNINKSLPPIPNTPPDSLTTDWIKKPDTDDLGDVTRRKSVEHASRISRVSSTWTPPTEWMYIPERSNSAPSSPTASIIRKPSESGSSTPIFSRHQILPLLDQYGYFLSRTSRKELGSMLRRHSVDDQPTSSFQDPLGLLAAGVRLPPVPWDSSVSSSIYSRSEDDKETDFEEKLSIRKAHSSSEKLSAPTRKSNTDERDSSDGRDIKLVPFPLFWTNKIIPVIPDRNQANHHRRSKRLRAALSKRPTVVSGSPRESLVASTSLYQDGMMSPGSCRQSSKSQKSSNPSSTGVAISSPIPIHQFHYASYVQDEGLQSYEENLAAHTGHTKKSPKLSNIEHYLRIPKLTTMVQLSNEKTQVHKTLVPSFTRKISYVSQEKEDDYNVMQAAKAKFSRVFQAFGQRVERKKRDTGTKMLKNSIHHIVAVDAATAQYDLVASGGWI